MSTMLCTANHTWRVVEETESGRHGRARQDQERWRVLIQVHLEGPDEPRLVLAGTLRVRILRDVEDVHARRGEARGFGVGAQAAVGAKERRGSAGPTGRRACSRA